MERELIIYKDYMSAKEIRERLSKYGVTFLQKVGERDKAEYWRIKAPDSLNELLYKYDPEVRLETSLGFYDIDKELVKKLPPVFGRRKSSSNNKTFSIKITNKKLF